MCFVVVFFNFHFNGYERVGHGNCVTWAVVLLRCSRTRLVRLQFEFFPFAFEDFDQPFQPRIVRCGPFYWYDFVVRTIYSECFQDYNGGFAFPTARKTVQDEETLRNGDRMSIGGTRKGGFTSKSNMMSKVDVHETQSIVQGLNFWTDIEI